MDSMWLKRIFLVLLVALVTLSCLSCNKQKDQEAAVPEKAAEKRFEADSLLINLKGDSTTLIEPAGDITVIPPDQVKQHLGEGGEHYQVYHFTGLATGAFELVTNGERFRISAEVTQFDTPVDAYGFYAAMRPVDAEMLPFGTESYLHGDHLFMVCGPFMYVFSTMPGSGEAPRILPIIAQLAAAQTDGNTPTLPEAFDQFPDSGRLVHSFKYHAVAFLEMDALREVFTADYVFGNDTLVLFISSDGGGVKYVKMLEFASQQSQVRPAPFDFDDGYSLVFHYGKYGRIVAGLKSGWLIGVVGYRPEFDHFIGDWVKNIRHESTKPPA